MGLGGGKRTAVLSGPSLLPQTKTLIAAMSVRPTNARAKIINSLIGSLVTSGVWVKLDVLYLFAAADSQAGIVNWKNPGSFNATPVASPTFTADRGYAGNGTSSYLSSGFSPGTAAGQFAQNSAHVGIWSRTNADSGIAIGADSGSTTAVIQLWPRVSNQMVARLNANSTASPVPTVTDSTGHFVGRRSASNALALFKNAISLATGATASATMTNNNIYIGCNNNNGTPFNFSTLQLAAAHLGANLTDQNITDLYNALAVYMTSVGAA